MQYSVLYMPMKGKTLIIVERRYQEWFYYFYFLVL